MFRPVLARRVLKITNRLFLQFSNFFRAAVNSGLWISGYAGTTVYISTPLQVTTLASYQVVTRPSRVLVSYVHEWLYGAQYIDVSYVGWLENLPCSDLIYILTSWYFIVCTTTVNVSALFLSLFRPCIKYMWIAVLSGLVGYITSNEKIIECQLPCYIVSVADVWKVKR
jgi:hypothetical protein